MAETKRAWQTAIPSYNNSYYDGNSACHGSGSSSGFYGISNYQSISNVPVELSHHIPTIEMPNENGDIVFNQKALAQLIYKIKNSFKNNYFIVSELDIRNKIKRNEALSENENNIYNNPRIYNRTDNRAPQRLYFINKLNSNANIRYALMGDYIDLQIPVPSNKKSGRLYYMKNYINEDRIITGFDPDGNFKDTTSTFTIKKLVADSLQINGNFNGNMTKLHVTDTTEAKRGRLGINYIDITNDFNYTGINSVKKEYFAKSTASLSGIGQVVVGVASGATSKLNSTDWQVNHEADTPQTTLWTFSAITPNTERADGEQYVGRRLHNSEYEYKILTGSEIASFLTTKIKFKTTKFQIDVDGSGNKVSRDIYIFDDKTYTYTKVSTTQAYDDFSNLKSGRLFVERIQTGVTGSQPYYFGDNNPIGNPGVGLFDYAYINNTKQAYGNFKNLYTWDESTKQKRQLGWDDLLKGSITTPGGIAAGKSIMGYKLHGAIFNDYAEYRATQDVEAGRCVVESGYGTLYPSTKRLQLGANIVSDTFGFSIGQSDFTNTPIAVCGRVLAYPNEDRSIYTPGAAVCSGPNGTISIMTREEIREWPDAIVGYVSEVPQYDYWGSDNVAVNGRIWIKVH